MEKNKLNPTIAGFIEDNNARNVEGATARFRTDAVVEDENRTHRGLAEIRDWVEQTQIEYGFILEPLEFTEEGSQTIVACLVSGNFPGSPVQLRFSFNLEGDKIAAQSIE